MTHGEHEKAAKTEHTPEPTDIHSPFNACMYRWHCKELEKQRDELLAALERSLESFEYIAKYGNSCGHSQLRIPDLKAVIARVKGSPA